MVKFNALSGGAIIANKWERNNKPLIICRRSPKDHDDQKDDREENVPESIVDPKFFPVLHDKQHLYMYCGQPPTTPPSPHWHY